MIQLFIKEDGTIDHDERDKKYRDEAKDKNEVKGWLPLFHGIGHQCLFKGEFEIPNSLKEAIKNFLIIIAVRDLRKNIIPHNSMLIHTSRFTSVQQTIMSQIRNYIDYLKKNIAYGQDEKIKENIKNEFLKIWNEDIKKNFDNNRFPESEKIKFNTIWDKVSETIVSETNPIDIVQINSLSDDVLDYDGHKKGWNVIVVGGAAISRGITLEGLTVSYFTRVAKIPTLDTLVQMGRWFGYRKGYEDLFRVYVPKTLHILFPTILIYYRKSKGKICRSI
jgi:hypothetical protein